jgi:hypothetical protein
MNVQELVERVATMEEASTLVECSKRAKARLGLRGGVVRNIILDSGRESRSLLDYVDPFSDIDCVVDRREDWISLSSSLASSVAYAGFYRWEIQTQEFVKKHIQRYATLSSERVIVWFDGSAGSRTISVESLVETGETNPALESLESIFPDLGSDLSLWDRLLVTLRAIRVGHQFEKGIKSGLPRFRFEEREPPSVTPDFLTVQRVQASIAHIAMTSIDLQTAVEELLTLDSSVHGTISRWGGAIASTLLSGEIDDKQLTVTMSEDEDGRRRIRMPGTPADFGGGRFQGLEPILPWTWLYSPYRPGCCEYRDFEFGVAVVASRGRTRPKAEQVEAAQIVVLTADEIDFSGYYSDRIPSADIDSLPIPGIVSRLPQSVVLRLDHGFPAAYLHRPLPIMVSALSGEGQR